MEERATVCLLTYLSCRMILFSFFQFSLKSVENSCQTVKKVLGETSFSPLLAFTEKNTQSSRNLRHKPSQKLSFRRETSAFQMMEITAHLNGAERHYLHSCVFLEIPHSWVKDHREVKMQDSFHARTPRNLITTDHSITLKHYIQYFQMHNIHPAALSYRIVYFVSVCLLKKAQSNSRNDALHFVCVTELLLLTFQLCFCCKKKTKKRFYTKTVEIGIQNTMWI